MFTSEQHATWYIARIIDQLQSMHYLRRVEEDDVLLEEFEGRPTLYWDKSYMITMPHGFTAEGALGISSNKVKKIVHEKGIEEWEKMKQVNLYINQERVIQESPYLNEREGFCVPMTLLLNVALICFGEKAMTNAWWSKMYDHITNVSAKKLSVKRQNWLQETLMIMYLRCFMYNLYAAFNLPSSKTVLYFARDETIAKALSMDMDPVTFSATPPVQKKLTFSKGKQKFKTRN